MKFKFSLLLFLATLLMFSPLTLKAQTTNPDEEEKEEVVFKCSNYYYVVIDEEAATVAMTYERELNGYHGHVVIPETVVNPAGKKYRVIGIGFQTFAFCDLTSIRIPESIEQIGDYAFYQASKLERVTLPGKLREIGACAFAEMPMLKDITIPASVEYIGEQGLGGNKLISAFNVDPDNIYFKTVDGVLYDSDMTRLVAFPPASNIIQYTLPSTVKALGPAIFAECNNLVEVIMHDYVEEIGNAAFLGCANLESVTIPTRYQLIPAHCFANCSKLVTLENSLEVVVIDDNAFSGCTSLINLNFLPAVLYIGTHAFQGCSGLTNVNLPENLEEIAREAFLNCSGLKSIHIGPKLQEMEFGAFLFANSLEEITVDENNVFFCDVDGVLFNKERTQLITYPIKHSGETYIVPEETETIVSGAFLKSSLKEIALNFGLEVIEEYAFQDCNNIERLTIPASVNKVGQGIIARCEKIKEVTVEAVTPPVAEGLLCFDDTYETCNLIVPEGSEELYWFAPYWTNFKLINGKKHIAVEETWEEENLERVWYNLQGIPVARCAANETPELPAGIYIVNGKKILRK